MRFIINAIYVRIIYGTGLPPPPPRVSARLCATTVMMVAIDVAERFDGGRSGVTATTVHEHLRDAIRALAALIAGIIVREASSEYSALDRGAALVFVVRRRGRRAAGGADNT